MKIIFTLLTLFLSVATFGQNFSGKVTYQKKEVLKMKNSKPEHDTPEFKERLNQWKKLIFWNLPNMNPYIRRKKNYQQHLNKQTVKLYLHQCELVGQKYTRTLENYSLMDMEDYIVKDSLHNSGWELSTESKKIGNYVVYKATKIFNPKKLVDDREETSNLLSMIDKKEPESIIYTAWYTPEIPIPNGPEKFGGLPGLILELHTTNRIYLCSEIILNPKKTFEIKAPKGKTISQQEFDKMNDERTKEYQRKNKVTR